MALVDELLVWRHALDIALVASIIYLVLHVSRGRIARQALKGVVILAVVVGFAHVLRLETFLWIIERLTPVILVALVVLFQTEIRRGLVRLGERSFGTFAALESERVVEEVSRAAAALARQKHGALIVFERETGLESFIETGVLLNAELTDELIRSIFFPHSPLHDGAIIVRGHTLAAAGCVLPFDHDDLVKKERGTRHRAATGISKETDAVTVVVSEETGEISLAINGNLSRGIDNTTLREMLALYLGGVRARGAA